MSRVRGDPAQELVEEATDIVRARCGGRAIGAPVVPVVRRPTL